MEEIREVPEVEAPSYYHQKRMIQLRRERRKKHQEEVEHGFQELLDKEIYNAERNA